MKQKKIIYPLASISLILMVWELLVKFGMVNSLFLPAPTLIFFSIVKNISYLLISIAVTLKHLALGYLVGISLALPFGLLLGWRKALEYSFLPVMLSISTVPMITFIPLFILWFGLNEIPIYLCGIMAAFFPSFLNTFYGVKKVSQIYIDVAKNFKIKAVIRKVILPASIPYIGNGLRQSIQLIFLVVPPAEMIMGEVGIGGFIWKNADLFRMDLVLAGMISLGLFGSLVIGLFDLIEKKFLIQWMQVGKND